MAIFSHISRIFISRSQSSSLHRGDERAAGALHGVSFLLAFRAQAPMLVRLAPIPAQLLLPRQLFAKAFIRLLDAASIYFTAASTTISERFMMMMRGVSLPHDASQPTYTAMAY